MRAASRITTLIPVLLVLGSACRGAVGNSASPAVPILRLSAIAPDSVQVSGRELVQVELRGAGFDTNRARPANTVRIGSIVLNAVPSTDGGTRIRVTLPNDVPSGGEAPASPWMNGRYAVRVVTPSAASDSMWLTITTPSGIRP